MNDVKNCPFCGESVLAVAIKCKHCDSDLTQPAVSAQAEAAVDYGVALVAMPVTAIMLLIFWVGEMSLVEMPGNKVMFIMIATVIGTALVAAIEASRLGMVTDREKGSYSPTAWFFLISGLWVVCFPAYMYKRKNYGLANRFWLASLIAILFLGISVTLLSMIEEKKMEIGGALQDLQKEMAVLGDANLPDTDQTVSTYQEIEMSNLTAPMAAQDSSQIEPDSLEVDSVKANIIAHPLCEDIFRQEELNVGDNAMGCSVHELAIADSRLNKTYEGVMANLHPDRQAILRGEQRAWIQEKDRLCNAEVAGIMNMRYQDTALNECLAEAADRRTAYLKGLQ